MVLFSSHDNFIASPSQVVSKDVGMPSVWPLRLNIPHSHLDYFNSDDGSRLQEVFDLLKEHQEEVFPQHIGQIIPFLLPGGGKNSSSTKRFQGSSSGKSGRGGDAEGRLFGLTVQLQYGHRETKPLFTVLTFPSQSHETAPSSSSSTSSSFRSLPLSRSCLVVWAYKYDPDNPDEPLPTEVTSRGLAPITSFFPRMLKATCHSESSDRGSGPSSSSSSSQPLAEEIHPQSISWRVVDPQADQPQESKKSKRKRTDDDGMVVDLSRMDDEGDPSLDADLQAALALSLREK